MSIAAVSDEVALPEQHPFVAVLDAYIEHHREHPATQTLWADQLIVFEAIREAIASGRTSGYVKLPPGSGKTVLFVELVEALNVTTLIVVPTKILLGQTVEQLRCFAPTLDVGCISGDRKEYGHRVTVTTYDTFVKLDCASYACIVFDEARMLHGPTRKRKFAQCGHAFRIGFDATPHYSQAKQLDAILGTAFHTMTIAEAISHGMLCHYRVIPVRVRADLSNVRIIGKDYDERQVDQAIDAAALIAASVQLYTASHNGERAIAFCGRIAHAEAAAAQFQQHTPASALHGELAKRELPRVLKDLASGARPVVCSAQLGDFGLDEPRLRVGFVVRPTTSPVICEQRVGRLLRLDKDDPEKVAIVYEFMFDDVQGRQVTFAEIAGGITSLPDGTPDSTAARKRRATTPKCLPQIEGIEVVTNIAPANEIVRSGIERREQQHAPPGWMTRPEFARRAGGSVTAANTLLGAISAAYPDPFQTRTDAAGRTTVYGKPDFMATLLERVTRYPRKNDAVPFTDAARILNVSVRQLRRAVYENLHVDPSKLGIAFDGAHFVDTLHGATVQELADKLGRGLALKLYLLRRQMEGASPVIQLASQLLDVNIGSVVRSFLKPLVIPSAKRRR